MPELVFEITQEADGGLLRGMPHRKYPTQSDTWDELRQKVVEAATAYFFDQTGPLEDPTAFGPRRDRLGVGYATTISVP